MKYRADIDGLRAVAVLSVIGYHAFPGKLRAGFIGVDIFFVISGFLISSIILSDLKNNCFSIIDFYVRRIKRIFPALILLLIASYGFGWFSLLADEYKQLGGHIAAGAGFFSNFLQVREHGYFDSAAETKPLLHLWSLAIEEQFYIFWPLLLTLAWKKEWGIATITAIIAILSFTYNIYASASNPVEAFYSPFSRFWELMIGGLLAYVTQQKPHLIAGGKNVQSFFGFALLAAGFIFINPARIFPSWWALLPTCGTFLIISAGQNAWLNQRLLSNKILVWFGVISFPLYLWHWPLLAFSRIESAIAPTAMLKASLMAFSVLLAWLTYKFVEQPIRRGKYGKVKALALLAMLVMSGYLGYICDRHDGLREFGFRADGRQDYFDNFEDTPPQWKYSTRIRLSEKYRDECNFYDVAKSRIGQETRQPLSRIATYCYQTNSVFEKSVFLWGDSHAQQFYWGLKDHLPKNWQILQVTSSGCWPSIKNNAESTIDFCPHSNWFALKSIREAKPDVVLVAQNGGHAVDDFTEISGKLQSMGVKRVVFIGPTPHWNSSLPRVAVRELWEAVPQRTYLGINKQVLIEDSRLKKQFPASNRQQYVSLIDFFCNTDGCLTYIGSDKVAGITSWDYGHLTPVASGFVARHLLSDLIAGTK